MLDIRIPWQDWEVKRKIGSGSFGSVYEIERTDRFGHIEKAALKVISIPKEESDIDTLQSEGYDEEGMTTFYEVYLKSVMDEYALMAELNGHPNIVSCLDRKAEKQENGIGWNIYIRLELLTPFLKATRGKEIGEEETVKISKDLSKALIACHSRNIIHRDIKPENVFVTKYGDYKLGDFGVAKIMSHTTNATKTGTPYYMAPEVCKDEPYGKEADIYSLGLVMYWLMNKRRLPFMPTDHQPTGLEKEKAYKRRVMGEEIPEPAEGSKELKRIILKATAYDPRDRYHNAEELLRDLEGLQKEATKPEEAVIVEEPYEEETDLTLDIYHASNLKKSAGKVQIQEKTVEIEDLNEEDNNTVDVYQSELLKRRTEVKQTEEQEKPVEEEVEESSRIVELPKEPVIEEENGQSDASNKDKGRKTLLLLLLAVVVFICGVFAIKNLNKDKPAADTEESEANSKEEETDTTSTNDTDEETDSISKTTEIIKISGGSDHTVGLKKDGTVATVGSEIYGLPNVSEWTDIIAISAGSYYTVGLKSDRTVVAVGKNGFGQCHVSNWRDIIGISAGEDHSVGLKSDGTVVAAGRSYYGQCNISDWKDIISIVAGNWHTVGLKRNGTVVAVGDNSDGQCDVSDWKDIISIDAGSWLTVGLNRDGTVVAVGSNSSGQCDVSEWTDIIEISAGYRHTVGLKKDGTVVAVGDNLFGQCDVSDWTDIIAISAGYRHTVGLKKDGTVVAVGNNLNGQCDVSDLGR